MNPVPTIPSNLTTLAQAAKSLQDIERYLDAERAKQRVFSYSDDAVASVEEDCQHVRIDVSTGSKAYVLSALLPRGWRVSVIKLGGASNFVNISGTDVTFNSDTLGTTALWQLSNDFEVVRLVHAGAGVFDVI